MDAGLLYLYSRLSTITHTSFYRNAFAWHAEFQVLEKKKCVQSCLQKFQIKHSKEKYVSSPPCLNASQMADISIQLTLPKIILLQTVL